MVKAAARRDGSAVIEGLVIMTTLCLAVVILTFAGAGFYNLVIMNSAAQTISLSEQTIMDHNCSPSAGSCAAAVAQAANMGQTMWQETQSHLMYANNFSMDNPIQPTATSGPSPTLPNANQPVSGKGWGWSLVQLHASFDPFGHFANGPVQIGARSLTVSYQQAP